MVKDIFPMPVMFQGNDGIRRESLFLGHILTIVTRQLSFGYRAARSYVEVDLAKTRRNVV